MNIVVWGGGLYGCHIAADLAEAGHSVTLYEKTGQLMSGAAKHNQHRLHLGWHYPRCNTTSAQAAAAFEPFRQLYSDACISVDNNLYLLHRDSGITAEQYEASMRANGVVGRSTDMPSMILDKTLYTGCWATDEMAINLDKLRYLVCLRLSKANVNVVYYVDSEPYRPDEFDYSINCTYTQSTYGFGVPLKYEVCVLPVAQPIKNNNPAITIMDGPYVSLYPTGSGSRWTLSSVAVSPTIRTDSLVYARHALEEIRSSKSTLKKYSQQVWDHVAEFIDISEYSKCGEYLVIKTKIHADQNDYRGTMCLWGQQDAAVIAGKLSGVMLASKEILEKLK